MWVIFLLLSLVILLIIALIIGYIQYRRFYWHYLNIPHDEAHSVGYIFKFIFQRHTCEEYTDEAARYRRIYKQFKGTGPFCGFSHILQPRILVLERELVEEIMIKNFSNFSNRGVYYNCKLDPLSGDLYSIHGNRWQEMRQKLEPIFNRSQIASLYPGIYNESEKLLYTFEETLLQKEHQHGLINVQQILEQHVLATLARCVFGLDEALQEKYSFKEFAKMTELALAGNRHGFYTNSLMARYPRTARRLRYESVHPNVQTYFLELLKESVERRDKLNECPQDYLQLLINIKTQELSTHAFDKDKEMEDIKEHLTGELAAHAFSFLKSGYRPTAKTLAYVLYELALNQQAQEQLRQEVQNALTAHNNEWSYECIGKLEFMGQIILETLRLHPVEPFFIRRAINDYIVPNHPKYIMQSGTFIVIPAHAMHNDPANYPEPHIFNPERFSQTANQSRERCLWLGFGAGPRSCIGVHFAQLQLRLAVARLILQYNFSFDSAQQHLQMDIEAGITLRVQPLENAKERKGEKLIL